MPSLSGNSTNGTPNWDKYVVNNNYQSVKYTIETTALFFKNVTNTKEDHILVKNVCNCTIRTISVQRVCMLS